MPKILINEIDGTSPGTPGQYSNYAVLITGFTKRDSTEDRSSDKIQPDSNGVYEFSSSTDFEKIIGIASSKIETSGGASADYHYGNQMAYELLKLGYPVIYCPINSINEMDDEDFWEIFKDKSSYDFRFVSHGLLESSDIPVGESKEELTARQESVSEAISQLKTIGKANGFDWDTNSDITSLSETIISALNTAYDEIKATYVGFEKLDEVYKTYTEAYNGTKAEAEELVSKIATVDDRYVTSDKINAINGHIANLAKYKKNETAAIPGRGDCVALIELDEKLYTNKATKRPEILIISGINKMTQINGDNGKYCAMTVPSVYYQMDPKKKFPGAFHYLACFANSIQSGFAEWYAAAGYTRGVSSYVVDHTSVKLGEIAINALEPRNYVDQTKEPKFSCNVIANFRGSYYLWGNRTAHEIKSAAGGNDLTASHFLNIRQLCSTIKKQCYVACRRFTFDPNSDTLWFNFVNAIKPTLELMKADQGVRDYKIVKVFTDKKATLKAKIRIVPIEAVEDFDLEVWLEDSLGEVAVTVNG